MKLIETGACPAPRGYYSQAVVANGFVYVSGQLPVTLSSERGIPEGIERQVEQVFKNIQGILQAAGSALDNLVSVQIFLANLNMWAAMDSSYRHVLGTHKPARTVIPCGPLRDGALLEVNAVAVLKD